jgi:Tol biopolymer transport system component/tRNA A-37 threonylcarbamoyl transferase component Bud32
MSLTSGQSIAHYRIDHKIGEGGMGEVWAATDTRLNRQVAIKSLPPAVAADETRMGRFQREAQLLAALSHPNIASIYGLEQVEGVSYLALELVEGDDLSERIDGRHVPYDEVVEIALQIAAGIEEAHDKGIIHRDLKPANIKLSDDGKVKVLDFGLAKALSEDPNSSFDSMDLSTSPTMTAAMGTQAGVILGTAAYMAPEQARGKTVDRRADIWAFGVILFEMLTGQRMYHGETVTDIIAAVVTREPDWDQLPAETPVAMRRVLRRCLQKDPRKRLRDIGDAALELRGEFGDEEAVAAGSTTDSAATPPSRRLAWIVGAVGLALGLILATVISTHMRTPVAEVPLTWSTLPPPVGIDYEYTGFLELSPDGRHVVFSATPAGGDEPMLWVRDLDREQPRMLAGTEDGYQPFWSPDSRSIGYFANRKLRRIDVNGGVSTELATTGNQPRGAHWGDNGMILYGPDWSQPLFGVSETGGEAVAITQFNAERLELSHRWPHMLPDGQHFLYYAVSTYPELNPENPSEVDQSGLYLGSLNGDEPRLLQTARSRTAYVDGALMYVDDKILTLRPFDLATLSYTGQPVSLVEDVTQSVDSLWGGALFSVSDVGTLMFVRGAPEERSMSQLTWYDREDDRRETIGEMQPYNSLEISHDGTRVVTSIGDPGDVWVHDLKRNNTTRFTFDAGNDTNPIWSPDDGHLLFTSSRLISGQRFTPSNLFRKATSGLDPEEHLSVVENTPTLQPSSWSPDGTILALTAVRPESGTDILLYSLDDSELTVHLQTEYDEQTAVFSPDGRWLAYASDESGDYEVYVTAFPGPGGKWQVSQGGGVMPRWRADGQELFYIGLEKVMAVPVEIGNAFRHDTPIELFEFPKLFRSISSNVTYDVTPDGQRFLLMAPIEDDLAQEASVHLVQGWSGLLD